MVVIIGKNEKMLREKVISLIKTHLNALCSVHGKLQSRVNTDSFCNQDLTFIEIAYAMANKSEDLPPGEYEKLGAFKDNIFIKIHQANLQEHASLIKELVVEAFPSRKPVFVDKLPPIPHSQWF